MAPAFPPARPHGPLVEITPGVFVVRGSFRLDSWGIASFPRSMTVLRRDGELTVVNSVRLDPAGEEALETLGTVRHVVRLGALHGIDDPYYLNRYTPTFWVPEGLPGAPQGRPLVQGEAVDFMPGAEVFLFQNTRLPEGVLRLPLGGGALVVCDCVSNVVSTAGFSRLLRWLVPRQLSEERSRVGSDAWLKRMRVKGGPPIREDYDRLLSFDFDNLFPAHGDPVIGGAREALRRSVEALWPSGGRWLTG